MNNNILKLRFETDRVQQTNSADFRQKCSVKQSVSVSW